MDGCKRYKLFSFFNDAISLHFKEDFSNTESTVNSFCQKSYCIKEKFKKRRIIAFIPEIL